MHGKHLVRFAISLALGLGLSPIVADGVGDATVTAAAPDPVRPGTTELGIASWYGPDFQGKRTASGTRFDQRKLTAAHPSLPLLTKARVTNLENGRSVEVTINDRGPAVPGRAIDLSAKAAKTLGMKRQGLAAVEIEALPPTAAAAPDRVASR